MKRYNVMLVLSLMVISLMFVACGISKDNIAETVKVSLQQKLTEQAMFKGHGLNVKSINVIHKNGNEYKGLATVTKGSKKAQIILDITVDGEQVMWQIPAGGMAPLVKLIY